MVSNVAFKYRDVLEDDAEEKGNCNEVEGAVRARWDTTHTHR